MTMMQKVREWLLGGPSTVNSGLGSQQWQQHRDLPLFDYVAIRQMLNDPTVRLGLATRTAPLYQAEFSYQTPEGEWLPGVKSDNEEVSEFVLENIKRIWANDLHKILSSQVWGWSAGEVVYRFREGRVYVDRILARLPEYVWPLVENDELAGVRFKQQKHGPVDLRTPRSFWHAYQPEAESPFGRSVLHGAYSPWADKNLNGGSLDVRRLFMHKDAYGGVDLGYPDGVTDIGQAEPVPNRDIAREIAEQLKAGGVTQRPSERDENGNERWPLTRATVPSNPVHILQYPKDLDIEILRGLEIPDDVVISEASGAWQGKQVPLQTFYTCADRWLADVIRTLTVQVLEPLVEQNFGPDESFQIQTKPLGEQVMEQIKAPGPDQAPVPQATQMSLQGQVGELMVGQGVVEASELVAAGRTYLDKIGGRFRRNGAEIVVSKGEQGAT